MKSPLQHLLPVEELLTPGQTGLQSDCIPASAPRYRTIRQVYFYESGGRQMFKLHLGQRRPLVFGGPPNSSAKSWDLAISIKCVEQATIQNASKQHKIKFIPRRTRRKYNCRFNTAVGLNTWRPDPDVHFRPTPGGFKIQTHSQCSFEFCVTIEMHRYTESSAPGAG